MNSCSTPCARAGDGRIGYGVPLDAALGESQCAAFLRDALHIASEGLKAGRSTRFIRDEIRAGLSQRLETAEGEALAVVLRHLGLTEMLAGMIGAAFGAGRPAADSRPQGARRAQPSKSRVRPTV